MSFPFQDTVSHKSVSQTADALTKVAGNPVLAAGVSRTANIQPMTPGQAFERYGIEQRRPAEMYVPLADASLYKIGDQVVFGTREYAVVTDPVRNAIGGTGHGVMVLEELQHGG